MPHDSADRWERGDLIRRVLQALDVAARTVRAATAGELSSQFRSDRRADGCPADSPDLVLPKVVAEAAMLLRCVAPTSALDERIHFGVDQVAQLLLPHARGANLLAALCLEPGLALDHALTHIQLRDLGYPDEQADRLLAECLRAAAVVGPERLPHRDLEQRWLSRIWSGAGSDAAADAQLLARSCLGRPLDALGSATQDLYAFTHVVLYASDMGQQTTYLPRPIGEITADADAALAAGIDADNLDLTAELLWTWPMLGATWSPAAAFSFGVLAAAQDAHGFLPGPGYLSVRHRNLPTDQQEDYLLRTSYHATLVMGLLCAVALRPGREPPVALAQPDRPGGAADSVYPLLRNRQAEPRWQKAFRQLDLGRRETLAPLVLSTALRRARLSNDLGWVRESLQIALLHGLVDGPTPRQAVSLLRRGTLLGQQSAGGSAPGRTADARRTVSSTRAC